MWGYSAQDMLCVCHSVAALFPLLGMPVPLLWNSVKMCIRDRLKLFFLEHGTYIELQQGEQFSIHGKMNCRGAYIENGLLRYTRVDERGNIRIVGYTFSEEFAGSLCTLIEPCLLYTANGLSTLNKTYLSLPWSDFPSHKYDIRKSKTDAVSYTHLNFLNASKNWNRVRMHNSAKCTKHLPSY